MHHALALLLLVPGFQQGAAPPPETGPSTVRLLELDGDGRLDRLTFGGDGSLAVALNRGARLFEPVLQELPTVFVSDVLAADLNADGHPDLYLVSPEANVALVGDGTGGFVDATQELGLADTDAGLRAERIDVDGDGTLDVLLHNVRGDVLFWGSSGTYERDPATPPLEGLAGVRLPATGALAPPPPEAPVPPVARGIPDPRSGPEISGNEGRTLSSPAPTRSSADSRVLVPDPEPSTIPVIAIPTCAKTVEDVTTGDCLSADSTPTLGRLYPLGPELFIDPGGSVGINTLTPATRLDVQGGFRARGPFSGGPVLENTASTTMTLASHTGSYSSGGVFRLQERSSSAVSSPYYPVLALERANAVADGDGIGMFFSMGTNALTYSYAGIVARAENGLSSTGGIWGALDFYVNPDDDIVVRSQMTLTSHGDLGIRTQTPVSELHVVGDDGQAAILVAPDATLNGSSELILAENADNSFASFRLRYEGSSNDRFAIQSEVQGTVTERLAVLRSNGNVGIGTSSPQARLHVTGGETQLEQEDWLAPGLVNAWINYGAGYSDAGFFLDSLGVVHLRGLVRDGTLSTGATGTICTLPIGYRPASRKIFSVVTNPNVVGRVDVLSTGEVRAIAGSNLFLSLEGVTFRAQ